MSEISFLTSRVTQVVMSFFRNQAPDRAVLPASAQLREGELQAFVSDLFHAFLSLGARHPSLLKDALYQSYLLFLMASLLKSEAEKKSELRA